MIQPENNITEKICPSSNETLGSRKSSFSDDKVRIPLTIKDLEPKGKNNLDFLCFDLSSCTPKYKFILLSSIIFVLYLTYGSVHEYIFRISGMKDKGWSITCFQFLFYALFSKIEMEARGEVRKASWSIYFLLSTITLSTMGFSNASLEYLNYPTQVIFKSCKLIPVLIGGTVIQGKKYGALDYLAASVMSLGLILFICVDININPNFNILGIVMITIALISDAVIGNYQERTMKHFESSNAEMSFYTFSLGSLMITSLLCVFGDIPGTLKHFNSNPFTIYGSLFLYSITGYLGIQAVFSMIRSFGAFTTVLITSIRKALTIVLSFMLFGKPFSMGYIYSGCILFLGIYLNLLAKKGYDLKDIDRWFKGKFKNKIVQI